MTSNQQDELVSACVAAEILGVANSSTIRYHTQNGNLAPAQSYKSGRVVTHLYRRADVERLRDQLASEDEPKRGRPRLNAGQASSGSGAKGRRAAKS